MPKRSDTMWRLASATLLVAFVAIAVWLLDFAFTRSSAYPPYSSLRADPVGSKALYETLRELPGLSVTRNRRRTLEGQPETAILFLGVSPGALRNTSKPQIERWEQLANNGARLVLALTPVEPLTTTYSGPLSVSLPPRFEIEKRWGLRTRWLVDRQERLRARMPKQSAFNFEIPESSPWQCRAISDRGGCDWLERPFGRGAIVLLAQSFPLSNEGLLKPNGELVATLIGASRRIIFDEEHLGVAETGSVGALIRRYRLSGAALVLVLLGLLFIWRQSGHFLPDRPVSERAAMVSLHASTGLVNLLRRHVPKRQLIAACAAEWKRSLAVLPFAQRARASRLDQALATTGGDPLAQYQNIVRSLHE